MCAPLSTTLLPQAAAAYRQQRAAAAAGGGALHPLLDRLADKGKRVGCWWERGFCDKVPPMQNDGTWAKLWEAPGCNGTPPVIYGMAWNPLRPQVWDLSCIAIQH
jgi:hypothetical protein